MDSNQPEDPPDSSITLFGSNIVIITSSSDKIRECLLLQLHPIVPHPLPGMDFPCNMQ